MEVYGCSTLNALMYGYDEVYFAKLEQISEVKTYETIQLMKAKLELDSSQKAVKHQMNHETSVIQEIF